ncbi:hypothetical protein ACFT0G_03325 [Streptomyces sp. NPDC057020]|uniref:hypothetical protein n=1 Tax=unclassified Streptomyces TaxID=2593676 RepID=UPI00362D3CB7
MSTRRFSRTASVFHKLAATREQAEVETKGWAPLASRIAVPALHGQIALPDRQLLAYEGVFATSRCERLLGDVIALADRDPASPAWTASWTTSAPTCGPRAEETGKNV